MATNKRKRRPVKLSTKGVKHPVKKIMTDPLLREYVQGQGLKMSDRRVQVLSDREIIIHNTPKKGSTP